MATIQASGVKKVCQHPNMQHDFVVIETNTDETAIAEHKGYHCPDCGRSFHIIGTDRKPQPFARVMLSEHLPHISEIADKSRPAKESPKREPPAPPDPSKGLPGTEMLRLTEELGVVSPPGCGCKSMAANMDRLGVDECRARIPDLRLAVAGAWENWGWKDKLKAVAASAWKAAGLGVSPTDPVRDLLEIALDRADAKRTQGE